jgi:hypothetical protein
MKYELRKKVFVHQNIPYAFNWNVTYHKMKMKQIGINKDEFRQLIRFLNRIHRGDIPNHTFNSKQVPRISNFKIRGIKSSYLSHFSRKLINSGKVIRLDSNSKLPIYAQKVYENFHTRNMKPGHQPVLKNILLKDPDSIAIEVPIWAQKDGIFLTGHIDLIQIQDQTIKVIDYKPEGRFILSLPQVATYGLLMKLKFNLNDIKCISFNRKEAWEFDPEILLTDVKIFLESLKIYERGWENFL